MNCAWATPGSGVGTDAADEPLRVVDIFRRYGQEYRQHHYLSPEQWRLMNAMQVCRTAALGGHLYACPDCGHEVPVYNSCLNRGCPNCQALAQAAWIEARTARLLPVGHHHVVTTLPSQLRPLTKLHPRPMLDLVFQATRETILLLAKDVIKGQLGVTAVLHTWTRTMLFHPHIHCIVTAGALDLDGTEWIERENYLFHTDHMKAVFRSRVLHHLQKLRQKGILTLPEDEHQENSEAWRKLIKSLPKTKQWVVYIEKPFGRSNHVLEYLGRYTHRIAISDHRLVSIDDSGICFRTHGDETITLKPFEFIYRFLQHVLPRGLRKIRHFGLYAPSCVNSCLCRARDLIGDGDRDDGPADASITPETWAERLAALTGKDPLQCPHCDTGRLQRRDILLPFSRGPPWRPPT